MTERDARLVRESFDFVLEDAIAVSLLFYGRLFNLEPGLRALFPVDLRLQSKKLMDMLTCIVRSLDNFDQLIPELRQLGHRHIAYGARAEHYEILRSALLWALGQQLDRDFSPEVRDAWSEVIRMVSSEMQEGARLHAGASS